MLKVGKKRILRNLLSSEESIDSVKKELEQNPEHTRNSLAKRVCEQFDLRD